MVGEGGGGGEDADEVMETDPDGRYYRYRELVGRGVFKSCHKSFDSQIGIDVAWSKINSDGIKLSDKELTAVVDDIQKGLDLDHPNIIKCFRCWRDGSCINLITELFTSGNLRQYRNLHKHLDAKAVKRMARQILRGLQYLHSMDPPIAHGDLRCDKIYVNGHSGEIKIGDLGLATLIPYRWDGAPTDPLPLEAESDIYAFGLCILELLTLKQLDPQHCEQWPELVAELQDEDAKAFVCKCLAPAELRPSAVELLEDPFLVMKKDPEAQNALNESMQRSMMQQSLHEAIAGVAHDKQHRISASEDVMSNGDEIGSGPIAVGKLRGEDYIFEFAGKVRNGKMHFRLVMTQAVQDPSDTNPPFMRTIDFVFDPEEDTADKLAAEISETFNLSPTDTEICAAALREWLAKEFPGLVESSK